MHSVVGTHAHVGQYGVIPGHAEQTQSHYQEAGDGAAAEGHVEGSVEALMRRFRGADVGAHGDVHADETGRAGEDGTNGETDGGVDVQEDGNQRKQDHADHADGGVLSLQVGLGAFLYRSRYFPHAVITGGLGKYPLNGQSAVDQCADRAGQCKHKFN
jgi:hypothetical protein